MKGCRLQPKMHPFTMWCNNKYKWLQRTLKVQSVLLKWWRAINNPTTQILIPTMNEEANSLTMWVQYKISAKICAAENTMKEAFKAVEFSSSNSCFKLVFNCQFFQKITFLYMPQIIKYQICNIVHAISSILLFIFSLSSLSAVFFFNKN